MRVVSAVALAVPQLKPPGLGAPAAVNTQIGTQEVQRIAIPKRGLEVPIAVDASEQTRNSGATFRRLIVSDNDVPSLYAPK